MKKDFNYYELSNMSKEEIFSTFKTNENGLTSEEVKNRLDLYGENIPTDNKKKGALYFIIDSLKDKFIIILIILAIINYFTGDRIGSLIILVIAIISALISFFQNYSTYRFNLKLKEKISIFTDVIRNNKQKEVKQEKVVLGDIITLSAGSVVPADLYLFQSKDLFINQASFTGESIAVEKIAEKKAKINDEETSIKNICLMGTNVISGNGQGIVIKTGLDTFMGKVNKKLSTVREETTFEQGINHISSMLIRYMVVISVFVFIIYGFIRGNYQEALLFSLSVAVGITPSMLPMIVNVNLTRGSKLLAKKKTLVKNIKSIQNLGSMNILCTDKTGTLTKNSIILQKYINLKGEDDDYVLKCAYVNSKLSTGFKNLVDKAINTYGKEHHIDISNYSKVDEIPFDYTRKRASIVVQNEKEYSVIAKGALEEILKVCDNALIDKKEVPISEKISKQTEEKAIELAKQGMQVIALAVKHEYEGIENFNKEDEKDFTLIGLIAFLDPPKLDAAKTIKKLKDIGVTTKILTGDNKYATEAVCSAVGIDSKIMLGIEIEKMDDDKLSETLDTVDVFARMNPLQKERIVSLLRKKGYCVGYMGDGVNDAPALHSADVAISVDEATDIAKESSDIILLEQNLEVVYDGAIEGRKVYGNIIKYMKLALSQDFGDVFSIMLSSICLPFLPLLPIQMLIQDFIVEISQIGIPYDNVDKEFLQSPKKWDTKDLSKFMRIFGIISSITDICAFLIFWYIFKYNNIEKQAFFQTAWFVECILSETLIIYYLRTNKLNYFKTNPSKILVVLSLITIICTISIPIILSGIEGFQFVILPLNYYLYVILLVILYALIVQIVKRIYIKKNNSWL
ncbi:MAG: magnesium-translocating P-type ATPase [Bacilli bacterium]|nr:magnesium-translocating P-type ATPase [Bacilli bacterium]MBR3116600.1 magnesium-translocating P-type ATPase [Bacilli bacterium]